MRADIHPEYKDVKVNCSCGHEFTTRSTYGKDKLHIEICSNCHPFYTNEARVVDTAGRVDRFKQRYGAKKSADKTQEKAE